MSKEQSNPTDTEAPRADNGGDDSETITCPGCGAQVDPGTASCPECGRTLYRTCFCGATIPVDEPTCPHCGADWSQSMRVARRKSRSTSLHRSTALRHAGIGAAVALGVAAVGYVLVLVLAAYGASGDPGVAQGAGHLALAFEGLKRLVGRIGAALSGIAPVLLIVLAVAAVGAAIGLGYYVISMRLRARRANHSKRRVRRSRR